MAKPSPPTFSKMKFYWNSASHPFNYIVYGCFCTITEEFSFDRDRMTHKTQKYSLSDSLQEKLAKHF